MAKFNIGDKVVWNGGDAEGARLDRTATYEVVNPALSIHGTITRVQISPGEAAFGYWYVPEDCLVLETEALDAAIDADDAFVSTYAEPPAGDAIYQPSHYASYIIEPITFTNANNLNFNRGNVVKYTVRAGKKGDPEKEIEDLEKARRYLEIEIECIRRRRRVEAGEPAQDVWKIAL